MANKNKNKKPWYKTWWGVLIIFFTIIILLKNCSTTNDDNSDTEKKEPLKAEIGEPDNSGTYLRVINRNDYDWHNVEITVNEYYSCWSRDVLKPGEHINVIAVTCNQFAVNQGIVNSLTVKADEGQLDFAR